MFAYSRLVVRRRVIVNLADGSAVEGVLFKQSGPLLVVKSAVLHERGAEPAKVDGDVIVERARVLFIQAL